jgi:hypothetical protein
LNVNKLIAISALQNGSKGWMEKGQDRNSIREADIPFLCNPFWYESRNGLKIPKILEENSFEQPERKQDTQTPKRPSDVGLKKVGRGLLDDIELGRHCKA